MKTALLFLSQSWPRLIPDAAQILQCLGLLAVAAGFVAIGGAIRLLGRDPGMLPEADLPVGWAAVAIVFTVLGAFTPIPFPVLAALSAAAALAAAALLWRHRQPLLPPGGGRMLLLLAPLLLITLSMQPSENDDVAQWLPNLRYLHVFGHFPGPGLPASDSALPAYPYAVTLVAYLAGMASGTLADTAVDRFNLLLLASLALLLVRLFRGDDQARPMGWGAAAIALAAVTVLAPTFVAKLVLSNYADTATSVALAFTGALAVRLLNADRPPGHGAVLQLGLCCAALILPKQANLVLAALLGIGLLAAGNVRRLPRLLPALAVPLLPYVAWRIQVGRMGLGGEQTAVPFAQWQFDVLPQTLGSIAHVMVNKGGYFGLALALCAAAAWARARGPRPEQRLAMAYAVVFVGFTLFLLWVYLAVYIGYEGISAASFWRYHTELGGLQMAALAALAAGWRHRLNVIARPMAILCLVLAMAGPVLAAAFVRFDVHPVKDHVRAVALDLAGSLPPESKVFVADPRGSGFIPKYLDWHMGFGRQVAGEISAFGSESDVARRLRDTPATHLYVLTWTPAVEAALGRALPAGASHLMARGEGGWVLVKSWPFAGFDNPTDIKY